MTDLEWKEFIIELNQEDKKVDLRKECKARGVGLNTLYRKVNKLKETDREIFTEFMRLHPYIPRDISTIDFEQLIRESIIFGVSQKDLENKYGVSAIIVHSEKGSIWLEKIRNRLIICKAKPEELAVWNDSLLKSAKRTPARLEFYQKWENDDIEKLVLELSEDESCRRNRQFIKQKILRKIFEKIKRWLK